MKLLLKIRLKSMFQGTRKAKGAKKKKGSGVLIALCAAVIVFAFETMLYNAWDMLSVYLDTDFAWLFFALAGLMAFAFGIFGTVFTTQNQMYQAKDNELLLAMPLKPSSIVGSRVLALYLLTIAFVAAVMLPAGLVFCLKKGFTVSFLVAYIPIMILIGLLTQAVTCLLGWLLHFLLAGFRHKAIVATVFMTIVMILYMVAINKLEELMVLLVVNGGKIASAIQTFAWPFYAIGTACMGNWVQFALFSLLVVALFGAVTMLVNATFVKAMLVGGKTKGASKQKRDYKVRTPEGSICKKESKKFFTCTTYLINLGMGLFLTAALIVGGVLLKGGLLPELNKAFKGNPQPIIAIIIAGAMGLMASMTPISAPSVSLEGKYIWIIRSMPISGKQVLRAKLRFHCIATVPLAAIGALVLGIVYGCNILQTLLAVAGSVILFVLCGVLGIVFNMCFPRLDWPNEATVCKQSMAVFFSMFGMMLVAAAYVALYFLFVWMMGGGKNSSLAFLVLNVIFAGITYLLYLLMTKWGGKKFETL